MPAVTVDPELAFEGYRSDDRETYCQMAESIQQMFPGCPHEEASAIATHTSVRGSGRVGRTSGGRALDEEALRAAVIAAIRHRHTKYDRLLMRGCERMDARDAVREEIDACWKAGALDPAVRGARHRNERDPGVMYVKACSRQLHPASIVL